MEERRGSDGEVGVDRRWERVRRRRGGRKGGYGGEGSSDLRVVKWKRRAEEERVCQLVERVWSWDRRGGEIDDG